MYRGYLKVRRGLRIGTTTLYNWFISSNTYSAPQSVKSQLTTVSGPENGMIYSYASKRRLKKKTPLFTCALQVKEIQFDFDNRLFIY